MPDVKTPARRKNKNLTIMNGGIAAVVGDLQVKISEETIFNELI